MTVVVGNLSPEAGGSPAQRERAERTETAFPFRPRLELRGEMLVLEEDDGDHETRAAVAILSFDYDGTLVHLGRDDDEFGDETFEDAFDDEPNVTRDFGAERRAARLLESLGAVELATISGCLPDYDSRANYLIALERDVHVGCSFSAHAVEELRRAGFVVDLHDSYPFRTVRTPGGWYGSVEADEKLDWFRIELGIEVDGTSYNLVPALLELLEECGEGASLEALRNCRARLRAVALGDGRYVTLPWERLERILSTLLELCPESDGQMLRMPMARMLDVGRLDESLGGETDGQQKLTWVRGEEWIEQSRVLARGPTFRPAPGSLRAELRAYQHEGLMWLEYLRDAGAGGVLADDMGLGKTLQTISLLVREKEARRMDRPTLIVSPTSLVGNWEREFGKFAPHLRVFRHDGPRRHQRAAEFDKAEVVLTSYPILVRDLVSLSAREYHYLIADEAQTIKNERSLASTSIRSLGARHRLAISGTPVENHLGELFALFEFAMPGLLGTGPEFKRGFRDPIEKGGDERRLVQLRERVRPFILRREKESVARDLPPKTELVRMIELRGPQRDLYESIRLAADADVRRAIADKGIAASTVTILDALMKLRQACCDPRLLAVETARSVGESAKYDAFFELLTNQLGSGRRILVFSQFTRMLGLLQKGLTERGIGHLTLTGSSTNRQDLVDRFERGAADVFLISLKAGGTGLNLVSADTVIHYDPWWNAAAQMQATDRAYRIGQKNPVFVYNLIAASSVEERMLALQQKKRNLASALVGEGTSMRLEQDDLDDLLAPLGAEVEET